MEEYAESMRCIGSIKNKLWLIIFVLLLELLIINMSFCQDIPQYRENIKYTKPQAEEYAFHMSLSILLFGLILCLAEIFILIKKNGYSWDPSSIRVFGLTLIIICGAVLITAGYSEYQIASMMGLLGTVAGYLLAKTD